MSDSLAQIPNALLVPFVGPERMRPLFNGAPHLGSLPEVTPTPFSLLHMGAFPEVTPQLAQASDRAMEAIEAVLTPAPHSSQMTPAVNDFADAARSAYATALTVSADHDDHDGDNDDENDERDNQPDADDLPAPAVASPLLNGGLTIAEIRANVGDNVPAADADVERILHFAVHLENIKAAVARDNPTVGSAISAEYVRAANTFNAERNILPRSLGTTRYSTLGEVQELRASLTRLDQALTRAVAVLPGPTATDRRTGVIENFNQLLMLLRAGMFRLVRLHRAGDDTSWIQGSLLSETRDRMIAQLAATDHIVVHTGPIQTPMYRDGTDSINFVDGFDLLLPMSANAANRLGVFTLNPLRSARGGYIHPNVSGSGLCFGEGHAAAINALRRGDLLSYFTVVKTVLSSFSGSPHHDASDWDRARVVCAECNQRVVTGGTGDAALFTRDGCNYHLGCTALVDGPSGEERLSLGSTVLSMFSGKRVHPNLVRLVSVEGTTHRIGTTEHPYFEEVQRHAAAGSYVCPRCETVHPPGVTNVIVDVRRGLSGMLGCPVCTCVGESGHYIDPRTNAAIVYAVTPTIRRALRPAAVVVPVACPSCAAMIRPETRQVVRHATTGDEVTTCAACDPYKLGIRCVAENLPEINAITARLVRAFADSLLIQRITISQPTHILQASALAAVANRLLSAADISRLFTEPAITFASKLEVWQAFMASHNESFSSFPLFTANPAQIAQHDYNVTALFNATYGSNIATPNNGTLWVGYDPGASDTAVVAPVDPAAADLVSAGPSGGQGIGAFGGVVPEAQLPAGTPEPDIVDHIIAAARDPIWRNDATFGAPDVAPDAPGHFGG